LVKNSKLETFKIGQNNILTCKPVNLRTIPELLRRRRPRGGWRVLELLQPLVQLFQIPEALLPFGLLAGGHLLEALHHGITTGQFSSRDTIPDRTGAIFEHLVSRQPLTPHNISRPADSGGERQRHSLRTGPQSLRTFRPIRKFSVLLLSDGAV
jgi:hypothetical protein